MMRQASAVGSTAGRGESGLWSHDGQEMMAPQEGLHATRDSRNRLSPLVFGVDPFGLGENQLMMKLMSRKHFLWWIERTF